ncbi:nudC domain-containing protein 2 [Lingula anatina]|uniref:NudC domain-containing protein 2 n=1 Tax=Lingula anatina TaxID=7574 RepID=A0A1S3HS43_LINAN|nr:nudC domain-containing protein 2 [Lingula anatina]|eukprot:XP_013388853.1 nudC domain-containing protein 2 [Lingula anatina]
MAHFDESSGIVPMKTPWGRWWQTIDEIYVEIVVPDGTNSKDIKCDIKPKKIKVSVKGDTVIDGEFVSPIHADESVWTLEDKKLVEMCLPKDKATAANCWTSLLVGQYEADPFTYDQMEKKMTLQRFQYENPGFDFSNADISGQYSGGGPELPSHS